MAGTGFIQLFSTMPSMATLSAIEGVVIINQPPSPQVNGVQTGLVTIIGEFEDGPFNLPYQVQSSNDFKSTFGGFGYTYNTIANNPCARVRKADNTSTPEYWNGNGYLALSQKQFSQLVIIRVNTTVGSVQFSVISGNNTPSSNGTIPAGTLIQDSNLNQWVTAQTLTYTAGESGPFTVLVRPALDDGSGPSALANTVTKIIYPQLISLNDVWAVNNPQPLLAALTENQLDVAYESAINLTTDISNVTSQTNIIFSARQSNAIRNALRTNAITASGNGCAGRMAIVRPPLGTTRAVATGINAPGVDIYRNQRVIYAYPGIQMNVPQIATIGTIGGAGFSATGFIDIGADGWLASILSNINPEKNPGELTQWAVNALGLESNNSDVQNLVMSDYVNFKAAGICAPRIVDSTCIFQSGCTSVNPVIDFNLRNIARQRMADYITDSLTQYLMQFVKLLPTAQRRAAIISAINTFLSNLAGGANKSNQRIDSFSLDGKSQNTTDTIAAGIYRIAMRVKTLSSMDNIILNTQISDSITITQV
jgi:hypothetical protein